MNLPAHRHRLRADLAVFLFGTVIIGGTTQATWLIGVFNAEVQQRLEAQAELPALLINSQQVWADLVEDAEAMRRLIGPEHRESLVISTDGKVIYATRAALRQVQIRDFTDTALGKLLTELMTRDLALQPCTGLVPIDDQRLLPVGRIHPVQEDSCSGSAPRRTVAWLAVVLDRSGLDAQREALVLRMALGIAALLAVIVPLAWLGLDRFILQRIRRTVEVLESFAAGAVERRLAPTTGAGDEITVLQQGTNAALDQIAARTEELRQAHRALESANADLERRVEERTRDLRAAQAQLVQAAHAHGRADIAIGVLHNIGTEVNGVGSILHHLARGDDSLPRLLHAVGDQAAKEACPTAPILQSLAELAEQRAREHHDLGRQLVQHHERITHLIAAHQGVIVEAHLTSGTGADRVAGVVRTVLAGFPSLAYTMTIPEEATWLLPRTLATEAVTNLIRNAQQAEPRSPIQIQCRSWGTGLIALTVTDDGKGLADDERVRAFRPDHPQRRPGSLGLHDQVNRLRRLGGDLQLSSDGPGRGCCAMLVAPGECP